MLVPGGVGVFLLYGGVGVFLLTILSGDTTRALVWGCDSAAGGVGAFLTIVGGTVAAGGVGVFLDTTC